jgi:hypothetical protein
MFSLDARLGDARRPCQRRIQRLDLRYAMACGQVPRLAHHERRIGEALLDGKPAARAEAAA